MTTECEWNDLVMHEKEADIIALQRCVKYMRERNEEVEQKLIVLENAIEDLFKSGTVTDAQRKILADSLNL